MKRLCLLLSLFALVPARADRLANIVEFTPAPGWVQADPREPGQPEPKAPTIKFVPQDGRHGQILLTLFMSDIAGNPVTDLASLKRFNLVSATPFLPTPNAKPPTTELKIADGLGIYMMNEDPSLVGKPLPPGEFRFATTASLYLAGRFLVHCTIFHDLKDSAEFKQALQILQSATVRPAVRAAIAREEAAKATPATVTPATGSAAPKPAAGPAAADDESSVVARPGLSTALHLPPHRFQAVDFGLNDNPGYFSFADNNGVMLSGWLEQAKQFKGMKTFWAAEKAALEQKGGIPVTDESIKIINGWNVVLYSVSLGSYPQRNLRACRVVGDTWADIHLSNSTPAPTWKELEAIVAALTLTPKAP